MNAIPCLLTVLAIGLLVLPTAAASPVVACVPDRGYHVCASTWLPSHACAWVKKGTTTLWGECVTLGALP